MYFGDLYIYVEYGEKEYNFYIVCKVVYKMKSLEVFKGYSELYIIFMLFLRNVEVLEFIIY